MINGRNKVLLIIIFSFVYVLFILVGLVLMSKLNYYTIHYTLKGEIIIDEEVSFGMNFLGRFVNWSNLDTYVPFFEDNFLFLFTLIFFAYFFSHIIVLIGWILFSFSSNRTVKKNASIISFFIYLGIYCLLIFYLPLRLDRMVNQTKLKYLELNKIYSEITYEISSSSAPYREIFSFFPIISLIFFYIIIYLSFQKLVEKFVFILKKKVFFRDFYEKVIKIYNEEDDWDVKKTLECWNKKIPRDVRRKKQIDFCEIVSSFANLQGGIIIIGITNSFPRKVIGVSDIENRIKNLEEDLIRWIRYENKFYKIKEILIPNEKDEMIRCIALLIFQTKKPVSVEQENGTISYKKRLGTGMISTTYTILIKEKREISKLNINFLEEMIEEYELSY
ncbi:hypothetical protein LCGC14_0578630 [marine sediment metagenome]|uniref:Schlafen AlbA-2 domain-containing protein n=1 Tax=marine sediment metagenome TaxID=412755 RepID=A0A0F9UQD1_9ZZZZ|nr:hypothetical protein [bacterium]